jgi:hypothetical protein
MIWTTLRLRTIRLDSGFAPTAATPVSGASIDADLAVLSYRICTLIPQTAAAKRISAAATAAKARASSLYLRALSIMKLMRIVSVMPFEAASSPEYR